MQVFKCELCKEISENFMEYGEYKQFCNSCNDILQRIHQEELMKIRTQFQENYGQVIANQVNILKLLVWIGDNHADEWIETFGHMGGELLYAALAK
jgi:hypothetical protein